MITLSNKERLKAELISGDVVYPVLIKNYSDGDIYLLTSAAMSDNDSTPGSLFELRFITESGETLNLKCKIKWSYKTPPEGTINIIAENIDPPKFNTVSKRR